MVFVTQNGDIGYQMTGTFPKRKYNVVHGAYPKKGWLKDNFWVGKLYPKDMPHVLNPASGIIASANNMATSKNIKYGLSHAFSFTTRTLRIREMINEKIKQKGSINHRDMREIQQDTYDIQVRDSLDDVIASFGKGINPVLTKIDPSGFYTDLYTVY